MIKLRVRSLIGEREIAIDRPNAGIDFLDCLFVDRECDYVVELVKGEEESA